MVAAVEAVERRTKWGSAASAELALKQAGTGCAPCERYRLMFLAGLHRP